LTCELLFQVQYWLKATNHNLPDETTETTKTKLLKQATQPTQNHELAKGEKSRKG